MTAQKDKTVCVVGLGYIGLPTAAVVARTGARVLGVDVSTRAVEAVNQGRIHIEEIDLEGVVQSVVSRGTLRASSSVEPSDVFIITVPTPLAAGNRPDVSYVMDAARSIAPHLAVGNIVIVESTCPIGTTEEVRDLLGEMRPDLTMPSATRGRGDISVAYCPERVLPGRILTELVDNQRCIGGITPRCAREAMSFYRTFVRGQCTTTTARAAEMVKLVEKSFRDVNIAFANELSMVAAKMDVDVWEVINLANRHPRVNILQPGPGVGGHCIAVDPWFIVDSAPDEARIIRTAREVNDAKVDFVIDRAVQLIERHPDAAVACLGLAFKANIDDFRESPAVEVASRLAKKYGRRISIVEPFASALPPQFAGTGSELIDLDTALGRCDILIGLVDHDLFKAVPVDERAHKLIYDTRGVWPDQDALSPPPARLKIA